MKSVAVGDSGGRGSRGGAPGCVVWLDWSTGETSWVEHDVPGALGQSCSPAQMVTAHAKSKAISNFVHTVISGVLFDQETEDCLEAVTTSLRGRKTETHI